MILSNSFILTPYNQSYTYNEIDENSPIGTPICRIETRDNATKTVTITHTVNFSLELINNQLYLTNKKVFDYESGNTIYPITLSNGVIDTAFSVDILPKNDSAATAKRVSITMDETDTIEIDLRALGIVHDNDLPTSENRWKISKIGTLPKHGYLTYNDSGVFNYKPDYKGKEFVTDSFSYYIDDSTTYDVTKLRSQAPIWVVFTFNNRNDEPLFAKNDTIIVSEDGTTSQLSNGGSSITANDSTLDNTLDRDGDGTIDISFPLSAQIISQDTRGSILLSLQKDGTFTCSDSGSHSGGLFWYEVTDGIHKDTATITVLVDLLNNNAPSAQFDTLRIQQGDSITVNLLPEVIDNDLPNDTISFTEQSGANSVTGVYSISSKGQFHYKHDSSRTFIDSIAIEYSDAAQHTNSTLLFIKILPTKVSQLDISLFPLNRSITPALFRKIVAQSGITPPFDSGTVADITMSREIEKGDFTFHAEIIDVVGNIVVTTDQSDILTYAIINKKKIRLFWSKTNRYHRFVGSGPYKLIVQVKDEYTQSSALESAIWKVRGIGISEEKLF